MKQYISTLLIFLYMSGPALGQTAPTTEEESKGASGLPLPRFASLQADKVNLRTGPGTRYPIEWVYVREGLPVEITAEFDIWRRVRDWEGSEGWVHKSALKGKRTAIVIGGTRNLYRETTQDSPIVAHLEQSAIGHIVACQELWCEIEFGGRKGYLPKMDFWGAYSNEIFD